MAGKKVGHYLDLGVLEDNIDMDLEGIGCEGDKWIYLAHNKVQRQTLQMKVVNV